MPSKHRYSAITPRLPTELKDRAQEAVAEMGTDLNALVTSFVRWYVGDINDLPERPISKDSKKRKQPMPHTIECKLCRVELIRNPSYAGRIGSFMHPIEDFGRAYGRNVDTGHDVRRDICEIYGVNTGAKLKEHGLPWGWIDEETGARLCCNEEPEQHHACARERFHEGDHMDANGHTWHQRNHFLLSRKERAGSVRHLDLYDSQANAQIAASYDIGGKSLEWIPQQFGTYHGRLPDRVAYIITYVDVSDLQTWLAGVA
jgi:hypothetical protein